MKLIRFLEYLVVVFTFLGCTVLILSQFVDLSFSSNVFTIGLLIFVPCAFTLFLWMLVHVVTRNIEPRKKNIWGFGLLLTGPYCALLYYFFGYLTRIKPDENFSTLLHSETGNKVVLGNIIVLIKAVLVIIVTLNKYE